VDIYIVWNLAVKVFLSGTKSEGILGQAFRLKLDYLLIYELLFEFSILEKDTYERIL